METIVQKFGGTSIGRPERMINVAKIVQKTLAEDKKVAVVLSAMSGGVKIEGTTSNLMKAADEAIKGGSYYKIIDLLQDNHLDTVEKTITDPAIKETLVDELKAEFQKLKSFLDAIQVIGEISPRSMDVIVSTGEKLSARIFTDVLNCRGVDAVYYNLDDIIDQPFKEVDQSFCYYIQKKLRALLLKAGAKVPVITGFFGFVPGGILKSIGRGYTDFTAALVATASIASELQIWKEVDGIYTSDPRKVESAKVLSSISPEEALELTYYGSEVIHPFTMEQVANANIPMRIKNTFNPDLPGTIIDPGGNNSYRKGATAATVKRGVTLINIQSNRMLMAYGFMFKVFEIFAKYEIIIDLVATSEVNISLTLGSDENIPDAIPELEKIGNVGVRKDMSIISLIGVGMRHYVGIASEMFSRLSEHGINIEAISQGSSEINISCVINDNQSDKALRAVHEMLVD